MESTVKYRVLITIPPLFGNPGQTVQLPLFLTQDLVEDIKAGLIRSIRVGTSSLSQGTQVMYIQGIYTQLDILRGLLEDISATEEWSRRLVDCLIGFITFGYYLYERSGTGGSIVQIIGDDGEEINMLEYYEKRCFNCNSNPDADPMTGVSKKLQLCSGCGVAAYCNASCQRANWSEHKPQCKEFRSIKSSNEEKIRSSIALSAPRSASNPRGGKRIRSRRQPRNLKKSKRKITMFKRAYNKIKK
jgi:hypothetical protein